MNLRSPYLILATLLLGACAADDDVIEADVETIQAQLESRSGSVLAEYDRDRDGTTVHGQFVKASGLSGDEALEALEIWAPNRDLALDSCSLSTPLVEVPESVQVEFLDVGPISIAVDGVQVELEARSLPDLFQNISGVVYGNDEGFTQERIRVPYSPGVEYLLEAPGGSTSGMMRVRVVAPEFPGITVIESRPIDETRTFAHRSGEDVRVEWEAPVYPEASELYLDVSSTLSLDHPRLRCRVEDDGSFALPESIIEQLRDESSNLEVSLRRINAVETPVDGLESVQIVFSAKDQVTLILP